jgi:hypothetical protein
VVGFRIDSHTIKRGAQNSKHGSLVPLGVDLHAYALDLVIWFVARGNIF